jgi:PTH1 family peptidyl-tRNA hydrolase
MAGERKFVVGLGNPGRKYRDTRHNVGFDVIGLLAQRWSLGKPAERFHGWVLDGRVGRDATPVTMLAPQTYMNRSGQAVRQMVDFYKASPADVLVVMDDMALALGRLRFRTSGSAGGHNGLADILRAMGSDQVPRLRIGIDSPPGPMDPADWVLGKFSAKEREIVDVAEQQAADAVEDWLSEPSQNVMEKYNRKGEA